MRIPSRPSFFCMLPLVLWLVSCGDKSAQNHGSNGISEYDDPVNAAKEFVFDGVVTIPGANITLKLTGMCTAEALYPPTPVLTEKWTGNLYPDVVVKADSLRKGGYLNVWSTGKKIQQNELEQFVNEWKEARSPILGRVHKVEKWTNSLSVEFVVATLDGYGLPHPVKHYFFINSDGIVCFVYARADTADSHPLLEKIVDSLIVLNKN